jgi:hypothetical protein
VWYERGDSAVCMGVAARSLASRLVHEVVVADNLKEHGAQKDADGC